MLQRASLVAARLGLGLLPFEGMSHRGTVEIPLADIPDSPTASRTLALAWAANTVEPAAVTLFRSFLIAQRARLETTISHARPEITTGAGD